MRENNNVAQRQDWKQACHATYMGGAPLQRNKTSKTIPRDCSLLALGAEMQHYAA